MISAKYRGIRIRVEESVTADSIVDSLALSVCHVDDIETVQPMPGRGNWIVVFTKEELVNVSLVGLTIDGKKIAPQRVAKERYVYASVQFVPPDVSNDEISSALAEFTEVKSIKYEYMARYPGIRTGKRLVVLKPRNNLPAYFDVRGTRASLLFKGRVACCPYCDDQNHLGRDCPNKRARMICFKCHQAGHFKRDCPTKEPVASLSADEGDERKHNHAGEEAANNPPPLPESSDSASEGESDGDTIAPLSDAEEGSPTATTSSNESPDEAANADEPTLDIKFCEMETENSPVLFSAPEQEDGPDATASKDNKSSPSPSTAPALELNFEIPKDIQFTPPSQEVPPAIHKMPQTAAAPPRTLGKSVSHNVSPRAGFERFPSKKKKHPGEAAAKALNLS